MNNGISTSLLRAVVIVPGSVTLDRVSRDECPPGWTRLRVLACGVCGTDLHLLHGMSLPAGAHYPVYPGHEVAACVIETDPLGGGATLGATVVLHPLMPCGTCSACETGSENLCTKAEVLGIHHKGGLSDELLWRSDRLVEVGSLDPLLAALLPDAVATAYHSIVRAELPMRGKIAVIGAGGVGTNVLELSRVLYPSSEAVAVVRSDGTATRIRSLGFPVIQGLEGAGRAVRKLIGEVDAVIDFSGEASAPTEGTRMLRRGGRLVLGSVLDESVALQTTYTGLVTREVGIVGSYSSTISDLRAVAKLAIDGQLPLEGLVSHEVELADASHAFEILEQRPPGMARVIVRP
jgi:2-desacetyl-2-hydroxyethyl bacteriochlorophyllide A dehydrogenase